MNAHMFVYERVTRQDKHVCTFKINSNDWQAWKQRQFYTNSLIEILCSVCGHVMFQLTTTDEGLAPDRRAWRAVCWGAVRCGVVRRPSTLI